MNFRMPIQHPLNFPSGAIGIWQFYESIKNKWQPNKEEREIVGIKDAIFLWVTDSGVDNSTDDAGNSGLVLNQFDTTSRADSAWIKIENTSGSSKTVRGAAIRGKPIIRLSGEQGFIHDDFVDYEDIYRNGEKKFELGNNFIVTKDQVEKLADFHWKNFRAKRHIYIVGMTGTRYWFSPGEWYTLTIGGSGEQEYINSVVECYNVQIERGVGELGTTIVTFREVYETWSKDSNAIARIIAGGNPYNMPDFGRRLVASSTYMGKADYYCDGASDEDQINAAISELAGIGGGFIELTEGTYYTDGAIVPANNIILSGKGWQTVIEKNGNFNGINLVGSGGSEYENVMLNDFKITKNAGDTETTYLIALSYVDNVSITRIWTYNSYDLGGYFDNCDNLTITDSKFSDNGASGLTIDTCNSLKLAGNHFVNNTIVGLAILTSDHGAIVGNTIKDNSNSHGIYFSNSDYITISGNICEGNGDEGNESGIYLISSDGNILIGNICEGNQNGIYINSGTRNVITGNRATGNTTANFTDNGTSTLFETAANDPYNEFT
jgi:parallel beta-helix repeat protein